MRLILVRHAQSVANAAHINQGWRHGRLTPLGKKQALKLAKRLARERIDIIYASDLGRVQQTLAPLRKLRPDIIIKKTKALREQNVGVFEGTKHGTIRAAAAKKGLPFESWILPGGESVEQMARRVKRFMAGTIADYRKTDKTICFFTHGGPISQISLYLLQKPDKNFREWHPENARFHVFSVNGWRARCLRKNVPP